MTRFIMVVVLSLVASTPATAQTDSDNGYRFVRPYVLVSAPEFGGSHLVSEGFSFMVGGRFSEHFAVELIRGFQGGYQHQDGVDCPLSAECLLNDTDTLMGGGRFTLPVVGATSIYGGARFGKYSHMEQLAHLPPADRVFGDKFTGRVSQVYVGVVLRVSDVKELPRMLGLGLEFKRTMYNSGTLRGASTGSVAGVFFLGL